MAIDVGIGGDMNSTLGHSYTYVSMSNPANNTGLITVVGIQANGLCENVEIAAFTAVGNSLTTRGYASLPNLANGQNGFTAVNGDFTPFEIRTGDYIGVYCTAGFGIGLDTEIPGVAGVWKSSGDQIPCSGHTFDVQVPSTPEVSIYATGVQLGQINIGDVWKDIQNIQINVGDSWKQLCDMEINIGDVWKKGVY